MPILISAKLNNAQFGQTAYKICYNNLCIRFGTWTVQRLNRSHTKVDQKLKFLAELGRKNGWAVPNWKQAFLIDSDAKLFMYLIQCIKFSLWKFQRLNWTLSLQRNLNIWARLREYQTLLWHYDTLHFWWFPVCKSYHYSQCLWITPSPSTCDNKVFNAWSKC